MSGPPAPGDAADGTDLPVSIRITGFSGLRQTPRRLEMRRLAAATRRLIEHLVSTSASTEELARAADLLDTVAGEFEAMPRGSTYSGFAEAANAGRGLREHLEAAGAGDDPAEFFAMFDHSPFIGLANPLAPPVELEQSGDRVLGRVTFGSAYEGPPGCVHGGYVAAVFDELLGASQSMSGTQGMTAHLGVDYRRPTPLHQPLRLEGWVDSLEGRKIWARGELRLDDGGSSPLLAEATALFIAFDPGRFRELLDARDGEDADDGSAS